MSSEARITARDLGKRFDLFSNSAGALAKQFFPIQPASEVWALQGVDLDISRGTCLGIIGRNGSGKSTLLSMLAGIQQPSTGTLEVRGRVAALLELGAGFHPDFTGRENVRMSAPIYGLADADLEERFDDIEAFAGIGDFIDRPVREYSSGMYARLAFAVAAHVDADILIVDEILGVGDVRFQQRCARFIQDFRSTGIVLLVSHSEETVLALCDQAIWLSAGKVAAQGAPRAVTRSYHAATQLERSEADEGFAISAHAVVVPPPHSDTGEDDWSFDQLPPATRTATIQSAQIIWGGVPTVSLNGGEDVVIRVAYDASGIDDPVIGFIFRNRLGDAVLGVDTSEFAPSPILPIKGQIEFACALPFMTSGDYTLDVAIFATSNDGRFSVAARQREAAVFQVLSRHISSGMGSVAQTGAELWIDGKAVLP